MNPVSKATWPAAGDVPPVLEGQRGKGTPGGLPAPHGPRPENRVCGYQDLETTASVLALIRNDERWPRPRPGRSGSDHGRYPFLRRIRRPGGRPGTITGNQGWLIVEETWALRTRPSSIAVKSGKAPWPWARRSPSPWPPTGGPLRPGTTPPPTCCTGPCAGSWGSTSNRPGPW